MLRKMLFGVGVAASNYSAAKYISDVVIREQKETIQSYEIILNKFQNHLSEPKQSEKKITSALLQLEIERDLAQAQKYFAKHAQTRQKLGFEFVDKQCDKISETISHLRNRK